MNKLNTFKKAISWVYNNSINNQGITVTSKQNAVYPEVTGYYIPTLLQWGEMDLALSYARHLCALQKENGAWYDSVGEHPYIFDTAQILKGLVAVYKILPEVKDNIIKGCDWLLSQMDSNGRLKPAFDGCFPEDESFYSELIHLYCLSPLVDASKLFGKPEYEQAAIKIKNYYIANYKEKILNFSLLSHFYAYVMEALYDLGEVDLCRQSMENLEKYRNKKGGIPGLNDVPWVCSTGMFQLAVVWYKLGELDKGNSLFYYALSLQNESGGWYGSYPAPSFISRFYRDRKRPYYFPDEEISWANKYFLDALALKEKLEFEKMSPIFNDEIAEDDGRYVLIKKLLANSSGGGVCDIGCGKGRYLKRLIKDFPSMDFYASDLSEAVMKNITGVKEKRVGGLTNIPYESEKFDFVYVCEAFEHAIHIKSAFNELYRVTKKGGKFVIIDKPIEKLGALEIYEWEQWISDDDIKRFADECGGTLEIVKSVPYEGRDDGLFRAWIVTRR